MDIVLTSCLAACLGIPAAVPDKATNLAINPSFEQPGVTSSLPDGWHGDPQVYSRDTGVWHSGRASLRFVNDDPRRYCLCTQRVPLRPGSKCRFSAWIKTKDISGNDSGATICLEWQDKAGNWLGGSYPGGVRGNNDWTRIEEITRLPDNAVSCGVACYVRQGMTGNAWFDDVEVVRLVDPPMKTMLRSPIYRGRVTSAGPTEAQVRVRLNLADHDRKLEDLRLEVRVREPAQCKVRWESTFELGRAKANPFDVTIPLRGVPVGRYDLELQLLGPDGRQLQTTHHSLSRLADDLRPACFIDQHRRLSVDGKPFFPLGMYFSSIGEPDLKVYAQSKFNCMMPYAAPTKEQMDLARTYGMKVIYSIKDWYAGSQYCPPSIRTAADEEPQVRARVRQFREHPALLAWYLNDELPQQFLPQLEAHQRWVSEEDPGHPTWSVLYQFREVGAYLNTFDVIGTDPYPIGRHPASMAAQWTAETFRQVERARPMWQVPQAHNWANYAKTETEEQGAHTPSYDEKRSMAWQCICEGATGLVFYSWYDVKRNPDVPFSAQWDGLQRIAAEIDRMTPALLSVEPVPILEVRGQGPSQDAPRWLHCLVRRFNGKLYLFAVNDGDGEGEVTFSLPPNLRIVRAMGEGRSVRAQGPEFKDNFRRLSVHVYQLELPPP